MNRQQKEAVVDDFKSLFTESKAAFLVNYKGLTVSQMQILRRNLRENGSALRVTKARLMKIAANDIDGIDEFKENFKDQVGLVFVKNEVPAVAKQLVEFSKKDSALKVVSGFFEYKVLTKDEIDFLASIPPRDVLLAQLVGTLQSPISGLVRLLSALTPRLVYILKQISEKK